MRIRDYLCACSVVNPAEIYHEKAVVPERDPVYVCVERNCVSVLFDSVAH